MQRIAYGPLGLKPAEFGVLTPVEFREMVAGLNLRQREAADAQIAQAWLTAALVRIERMPSLGQLLGTEGPAIAGDSPGAFDALVSRVNDAKAKQQAEEGGDQHGNG
jgi:hypothetical protein